MKLGVYRHYKGATYLVLGEAHDANADELFGASDLVLGTGPRVRPDPESLGERRVIVYVGLERAGKSGPPMAVRTYTDFTELICTNSACVGYGKHTGLFYATFPVRCRECSNGLRPRFEKVVGQ